MSKYSYQNLFNLTNYFILGVKFQLLSSSSGQTVKKLVNKPLTIFWITIHSIVVLVTSFNIVQADDKKHVFLLTFLLLTTVSVNLSFIISHVFFSI